MRRVKGIAKAVVTIAGAISVSSPLIASSSGGVAHAASVRQEDREDLVKGEHMIARSSVQEAGGTSNRATS